MKIVLPSILTHAPEGTLQIIKPSTENGSLLPIAVANNEASPRSRTLGVRKVCLTAGQATPFHLHIQKEKVYVHHWGDVTILMEIDGQIVSRNPQQQGPIVVPAGIPHALICPINAIGGVGHVHVITSDQDPSDVYWEQELVQSKAIA